MILFIKIAFMGVLLSMVAHPVYAQLTDRITVYAAASLKDALDAVLKANEQTTRAVSKVVYAGSATLARQIEHGAPADIFISADREWMDYLDNKKLLRSGSRVDVLNNRLVLIAPAHGSAKLSIAKGFPLAAALGQGRLAMADPDNVPAGRYGKAALQALGVWDSVAKKIAPSENVRVAMLLVARGETPFGIVYASDALADTKVRVLGEFPAQSHPPIVYPAALLASSRSTAAVDTLAFLRSTEARALWRKHGFGVIEQ